MPTMATHMTSRPTETRAGMRSSSNFATNVTPTSSNMSGSRYAPKPNSRRIHSLTARVTKPLPGMYTMTNSAMAAMTAMTPEMSRRVRSSSRCSSGWLGAFAAPRALPRRWAFFAAGDWALRDAPADRLLFEVFLDANGKTDPSAAFLVRCTITAYKNQNRPVRGTGRNRQPPRRQMHAPQRQTFQEVIISKPPVCSQSP